jgi:hypothetical protein
MQHIYHANALQLWRDSCREEGIETGTSKIPVLWLEQILLLGDGVHARYK